MLHLMTVRHAKNFLGQAAGQFHGSFLPVSYCRALRPEVASGLAQGQSYPGMCEPNMVILLCTGINTTGPE